MMNKLYHTVFSGLEWFLNILFPTEETPENFSDLPRAGTDTLPAHTAALFAYRDEKVKLLVWEIKYYKNETITVEVGKILADRITHLFESSSERIYVVPVPLTERRLRERGYNHTELIAKAALEFLPAKKFVLANDVVVKVRHTPKQASVADRSERLQNMRDAFAIKGKIPGKNFLIIDDVITTGATIQEVRKILEQAGARTFAISIAH